MSDNKQASNALLKGIEHIVKTELEKAPIDKTYTAIIKAVKENNLYDISMQGQTYYDIPSLFKGLSINSIVKVKIPQGQYSLMYIEGQLNMDNITEKRFLELTKQIGDLQKSINILLQNSMEVR